MYPRLVSPDTPPSYDSLGERVTTGIAGLDTLLSGGLPRGRSTFLVGPTGSGKTTLALQFALEGVRRGEESSTSISRKTPRSSTRRSPRSAAIRALRSGGVLDFIYVSPVELRIDSLITTLFQRIQARAVRRIIVDAVGDLVVAPTICSACTVICVR